MGALRIFSGCALPENKASTPLHSRRTLHLQQVHLFATMRVHNSPEKKLPTKVFPVEGLHLVPTNF